MYTQMDYILNGEGHGPLGEMFAGMRFDPGLMRPYWDENRRNCVTVNCGRNADGTPILRKRTIGDMLINEGITINGPTQLRKLEWVRFDRAVKMAARERLQAWTDLMSRSSYGGFDGMAVSMLEYETMSEMGEALVDMDGLTEGRSDALNFQLEGTPLPITHADFWIPERKLATSRNSGVPLSVRQAEQAGRRVAEQIEKTLLGTVTGLTYGGTPIAYGRTSKVYGYTNFPGRVTKTNLTTPTGSNIGSTISDVLAMRDLLYAQNHFGPFMIYHSTDWDKYLDADYILTGGNVATQTGRQRLKSIEGIIDVRRLDFLKAATNPFTLLMVELNSSTVEGVDGMGLTTVQWQTHGGMKNHFKVMAIQVPRFTADYYGRCGLCHGTTS